MDGLQTLLDTCKSMMAFVVRFNSATAGRDKLCRFTQYASKFGGHILKQKEFDKEVIAKLKKLEVTISTSRKTFRVGKFIDMAQGAIKSLSVNDPVIRICILIARICRTVYFIYDLFNWATRVTIMQGTSKVWAQRAAPFWFVAVVVSLIRDIYEIITYLQRAKAKNNSSTHSLAILEQRPDIVVDTVKNASDFLIPLDLMGRISLTQGTVGLLGLISSSCGILALISPLYKLSPM